MKVQIFKGYWTITDVRKNHDMIFIYGDNDCQIGKGGQAIIRNEPNTFGISTKKFPNNRDSSFYTDDEYEKNIIKITNSINRLVLILKQNLYKGIILPEDGLGTGLADLPRRAPKTFKFLNTKLEALKKIVDAL